MDNVDMQENSRFDQVQKDLREQPKKWLVSGCAGFIGSNLVETLLKLDQAVVGLDNFSTGHQHNLDEVRELVGELRWSRFRLVKGDIRDLDSCRQATEGVDYVLHQAALGSVPRSVADPIATNDVNIGGFLNMLTAARDAGVSSFVYAASSSTYGDHPGLPKVEDRIGNPLSPYAVTKYVNELYADVFARCYGFKTIGLRYFNVFGKRQDPNGAYAAVIPKWISAMIENEEVFVNGTGDTSRDFCYVENAIQANLLAATAAEDARGGVYNVAVGANTSLNELIQLIKTDLERCGIVYSKMIQYRDERPGDVMHSQANIEKAAQRLGFVPSHSLSEGLRASMYWYIDVASNGSRTQRRES